MRCILICDPQGWYDVVESDDRGESPYCPRSDNPKVDFLHRLIFAATMRFRTMDGARFEMDKEAANLLGAMAKPSFMNSQQKEFVGIPIIVT